MTETELIIDLYDLLSDSAAKFEAADLQRHVATALIDLARVAPLIKRDSLTLVADQAAYTAPSDMHHLIGTVWGVLSRRQCKPWNNDWPGRLPDAASRPGLIVLTPAPTAAQIASLGAEYPYDYAAHYVLSSAAADSSVPDRLKPALLYRAAAEAMLELATRGVAKPVALGGSANGISMPRNGHPAALSKDLMFRFRESAAA